MPNPLLIKAQAAVFKKHLYSDVDRCWDEITYLDNNLEISNNALSEGIKRQVWAVGVCASSDGFVALLTENMNSDTTVKPCWFYDYLSVDNLIPSICFSKV